MPGFRLSSRSKSRLEGVHQDMVDVCLRAIELTRVDFGITEGLRTLERQKELFESRRSQTMKSKHLDGLAVDVAAYFGSEVSWDINVYDDIADEFAEAGRELSIPIRWGGAWTINDISAYQGTMEMAHNAYIDTKRAKNQRPFIDGPHFELAASNLLSAEYE